MPQAREEARVPKRPIRANGKFWGKFMLSRVPGQVPKECLDEYLAPGHANRRSKRPLDVQMGGAYVWKRPLDIQGLTNENAAYWTSLEAKTAVTNGF